MKTIKRFVASLLSILILVYIILALFGWLYSDRLIFFPQKNSYVWSDDLIKIKTQGSGGPHFIVARYRINPDARYTLLYSHGNAVDLSQFASLQQKFYEHGFSSIVYDYSGYGLSEGEASEQQVYNDVQSVYRYLQENYLLSPQDIISYGHSLGAAVATDLAYKKPVAALILENPFVSAFRVKTVVQIVPFDKFSSIDKIDAINAPLLVLHSRDDQVIPFWHGKRLYQRAIPPKQNGWFNSAGHSGISHTTGYWSVLADFVLSIDPAGESAAALQE